MASAEHIQALNDAANRMRISAIEMTCASNSGHPTSSCSAAEIMATLFFDEMHYDKDDPKNASADRFVLSKVSAALAQLTSNELTIMPVGRVSTMTLQLTGHWNASSWGLQTAYGGGKRSPAFFVFYVIVLIFSIFRITSNTRVIVVFPV